MKSIFDVQQLLKRYGTIIYTGSRVDDLELMKEELKEMQRSQLIDQPSFEVAKYLIEYEISKEQKNNKK